MPITCKRAAVAALLFLCSAFNSQIRAAEPEIAVVVKIGGIPWFTAMEQGIKRAGKEEQVNAYMVGPTTSDPAQQVRAVEDLIAKRMFEKSSAGNRSSSREANYQQYRQALRYRFDRCSLGADRADVTGSPTRRPTTHNLLIACRVEPADTSDRRAAALLLGGLGALFPNIRTVIADAGHQSRKLARHLLQQDGWKLQIVKRRRRAFKITGLTWIVERSFAWLGRNRRLSKDYEYSVQTSETFIDIASTRLILNRLASA